MAYISECLFSGGADGKRVLGQKHRLSPVEKGHYQSTFCHCLYITHGMIVKTLHCEFLTSKNWGLNTEPSTF